MAEADELAQRINSDVLKEMEEEHRLQFEKHAQNLKKIKADVQDRIRRKEALDIGSGAEGMHEAIQDIVKAMHDLTSKLFDGLQKPLNSSRMLNQFSKSILFLLAVDHSEASLRGLEF